MQESFSQYLDSRLVEPGLKDVLLTLAEVFPRVAQALKTSQVGYSGTENVYGEKQLKLDVHTNELFVQALKNNPQVFSYASEEMEDEVRAAADGHYAVAFDPLDGSSLVDVNLAVGSIFGIYPVADLHRTDPDKTPAFIGRKTNEQVAALIVVYGPRLTFMISVGQGTQEFLYDEHTCDFLLTQEIKIANEKKMFAPGNLRACKGEKWYLKLLEDWVQEGYTLRYSGGMVPDVNQILRKGGGIFTYPGYSEQPLGKLRLLYECAPMAYLMEQAGGVASNGKDSILEMVIEKLDQRTPIFLGSTQEVEKVKKYLDSSL